MSKTILILGGTKEAADLAKELVEKHPDWRIISSLAGRTETPDTIEGEVRIGGFGGALGLEEFIKRNQVDEVIDGTHPFASNISKNAILATQNSKVRHTIIQRAKWQKTEHDIWIEVENIEEAARKLPAQARAFLALGSQHIDAFSNSNDCHFIVRMIDQPKEALSLKSFELELGKPAGSADEEQALFEKHEVTHLVARNSGGTRSYAKIIAARNLKLPVIMIKRPKN